MNVTRREKQIVAAGAVFLPLAVLFQVLIRPALERVEILRRVIPEKQQELSELRIKSGEYGVILSDLQRIRSEISQQQGNKQILSFLERIQKDCGLSENVVYMKPATMVINDTYEKTTIEIKLQGVTLDRLIRFLLEIESSGSPAAVNYLDIRHGVRDPQLLDIVIKIATFSMIGQD